MAESFLLWVDLSTAVVCFGFIVGILSSLMIDDDLYW
jgi:hypothetical protein